MSCLVLSMETRLGQAAPRVVAMEAILAACPRRVSMDKTRQDMVVKMFLWARQNRHKELLAVTCGLDPRG